MAPTPGWQTVLALLETHRAESREDHSEIFMRLTALEVRNAKRDGSEAGAQKAQDKILGVGKATVAVVVAVVGMIIQVANAVGHTKP